MAECITFAGFPYQKLGSEFKADIVILGIPFATPYPGKSIHSESAPRHIRKASNRYRGELGHYDFDLGGPLLGNNELDVCDCGDLTLDPSDPIANRQTITDTVKHLLDSGAIPVVFGGDDSIPIPFIAAFEKFKNVSVLQIDAHIDWRDEVGNENYGYSSTMRRVSEMPWIGKIIQVGMRGVGSARTKEVEDARQYGAKLVTAKTVWDKGVKFVVDQLPETDPCILTIDCDGLDPAVMPAVMAPGPGGLSYRHVIDIIHGITQRTKLVGFDIVELEPSRDLNGIGAFTASRIVSNTIGSIARQLSRPSTACNM